MERMMADCRRFESDIDCQLTIIGPEDDVVAAAAQHGAASHGHEDTPEFRERVRSMLEPESAYMPGERRPQLHQWPDRSPRTSWGASYSG
jgi:hypothetical protein